MKIFCIAAIIILVHVLNASDSLERCVTAYQKVIIDTDAGADDALAILLALKYEQSVIDGDFKILAITCVYGNTYLNNVEQNVLKTLTIAGRNDIPVYSGNRKPLIYNFTASDYFGKDGFGDFEFDKKLITTVNKTKHASQAIIDLVKQYPGEVTIICIGPMTNLATAMILEPDLSKYIKDIFVMGGSVKGVGNKSPNVEYNFSMDPESNFLVLNSTTQTSNTLIPWETSSTNAISLEWRQDVFGKFNSSTVTFLNNAERISLAVANAWHPADAITVAIMIWPEIILGSALKNVYPVVDGIARGSLLVDYTECTDRIKNIKIVQNYNVQQFLDKLLYYFH